MLCCLSVQRKKKPNSSCLNVYFGGKNLADPKLRGLRAA
jgi:hypothetical protein